VDVLVTIRRADSVGTRIILQNIKVLAAGPYLQKDKEDKPVTVSVVTLELTPDQAEMVAHAQNEGDIRLALRNQLDQEEVATLGTNSTLLLTGGRRGGGPADSHAVEVVLGTKVTRQTF
jgi:pilus assembly protein CpaB